MGFNSGFKGLNFRENKIRSITGSWRLCSSVCDINLIQTDDISPTSITGPPLLMAKRYFDVFVLQIIERNLRILFFWRDWNLAILMLWNRLLWVWQSAANRNVHCGCCHCGIKSLYSTLRANNVSRCDVMAVLKC